MAGLDVVATWPELFVELDDAQRDSVRQTFAMDYLADGEPDRAAVADLVDLTLGRVDIDAYLRRSAERAATLRTAS